MPNRYVNVGKTLANLDLKGDGNISVVKFDGNGNVTGQGEVPEAARQWLLAGHVVADYVAPDPAVQLLAAQNEAKGLLDAATSQGRSLRGIISLVVSELNILRAWIVAFETATAAATTLTDFKTRIAALATTPPRTQPQVVTAIKAAIDTEN